MPNKLIIGLALVLALTGCGSGGRGQRQQTEQGSEERQTQIPGQSSQGNAIRAAQERAISIAHGGTPNVAIPWSEPKSALEGAIVWDPTMTMTYSCRQYRQTLTIAGELLTGTLTACPMGDATWKLVEARP